GIGGKYSLDRAGFRQDIDDSSCAGEARLDHRVKEFRRDIDAAIRDPVVKYGRGRQAMLPRFGGDHPVQRKGGIIVDPEDVLFAEVDAQRSHKAAGGGSALLQSYAGELALPNAGHGVVANSQAQQRWRRAAKAPVRIEDKDLGI